MEPGEDRRHARRDAHHGIGSGDDQAARLEQDERLRRESGESGEAATEAHGGEKAGPSTDGRGHDAEEERPGDVGRPYGPLAPQGETGEEDGEQIARHAAQGPARPDKQDVSEHGRKSNTETDTIQYARMIYGYIRVSCDKQTVENQRFEINKFCERKSLAVDD